MKKIQKFMLASFISIANILPLELPQTNFFYKGDPEIIRLRGACNNEVNLEISKEIKSGITTFRRGSLPTIYVYLSKDQKDFRKTITRALEDSTKKQSISLADSELIALTKHLLGKSKMLEKYKDVKIQEIIEILSCVDKAMKIKNNQIPIGFETQEQVDKLLGKVTRVKGEIFDDVTNSFYSEYQSPKNRSQNYDKPFKNDYFTD